MSDPVELSVNEVGDGPAIVFVHGWLNDATIWDGVVAELAESHRCLAVDLRGHGRSPATGRDNYGRAAVLADLARVLSDRGLERAVFVGHSLGGYLSLALAIEQPTLVSALGLVAAGPGFRNPDSREAWNASVLKTAEGRDLPDGMEAISMHVDSMVMDRLDEISVPAAVVVGERDKRFLASAAVFAKNLDVVHEAIVADAGHMVHLKQPVAVAEALRPILGS